MFFDMKCLEHSKALDRICLKKSCNNQCVLCESCVSETHNSRVHKIIKLNDHIEQYQLKYEQLNPTQKFFEESKEQLRIKDDIMKQVNQYCDKILSNLSETLNRIKDQIETHCEEKLKLVFVPSQTQQKEILQKLKESEKFQDFQKLNQAVLNTLNIEENILRINQNTKDNRDVGKQLLSISKELLQPLAYLESQAKRSNFIASQEIDDVLKKDSYKNSLKNYILQPKNEFKVLNDHKSYIYTVAFSPDGNTFATGSCDKTIKIYDCNSYHLIVSLLGHTGYVYSLCYSSDSQKLYSGIRDRNIQVWEMKNHSIVKQFNAHKLDLNCISLSRDDQILASCGDDKNIFIWDTNTFQIIKQIKEHQAEVKFVKFSSKDTKLFSASDDKTINIWDSNSFICLYTLQNIHNIMHLGNVVSFSPQEMFYCVAGPGRNISIYNFDTNSLVKEIIDAHESKVLCVTFSQNGRQIISADQKGVIKIISIEDGVCTNSLIGHKDFILSLELNEQEDKLLSGGDDNTARLWNMELIK